MFKLHHWSVFEVDLKILGYPFVNIFSIELKYCIFQSIFIFIFFNIFNIQEYLFNLFIYLIYYIYYIIYIYIYLIYLFI